jgi:protein TonB
MIASVGLHAAAVVGLIAHVGAMRSNAEDEEERVRLTFYEAPPTLPEAGGGSPEPAPPAVEAAAPEPTPTPRRPRRRPTLPEPAAEPEWEPEPIDHLEPTGPALPEPVPCSGAGCDGEPGAPDPAGGGGGGSGGGTGTGSGSGTGSGTGPGTGTRSRAMELTAGMTPPRAISAPQDRIREALRRIPRGTTVTLVARVEVGEDGRVRNVVIVRGHALLDDAVRRQIMSWRYQPAIWQGRPVAIFKNEVMRLSLQEN